ncbi:hypothetical protein Val02_88240 [Virgisporangium aliadipatigenens]|uniref:Uncharacterized protein n=1 Tax=Virgisporangium aliadipatigenens TaxID=741659 RepID=A0A8J3YYJ7_9ACTN|nr:hypothetical protein Val02_88240 [Virgisporangium aliadipatigenens]
MGEVCVELLHERGGGGEAGAVGEPREFEPAVGLRQLGQPERRGDDEPPVGPILDARRVRLTLGPRDVDQVADVGQRDGGHAVPSAAAPGT